MVKLVWLEKDLSFTKNISRFCKKIHRRVSKYQPENPMNEETKLGLMAEKIWLQI